MAKKTKKSAKSKSSGKGLNGHAKPKRVKQAELPGMERVVHADVRDAAEAYVEVRDERQSLTQKEVEAKGELMGLMKKHELTTYIDEGAEIEVEIVATEETVKVRHYDPEKKAARAARKAERESGGAGEEASAP